MLDRLIKPFRKIRLDADRLYTRNHLWLQKRDQNRWRLGMDLFATKILGQVTEIIYPTYTGFQGCGSQLLWVNHIDGMILVRSPVATMSLQLNKRLRDTPSLLLADPLGDGWLVDGDFQTDEDFEYLIPQKISSQWLTQEVEWLFQELKLQLMNKVRTLASETMEDGGIYVTDICTALGPIAHRDILNSVLNLP